MAKTRSQTGNITIKKEEEEDRKPTHILNGVSNTAKKRDRITKRRNSRNLPVQQVKVEENTDTKSLLKSASKYSRLPKARSISQEQINRLIDYVANHGMDLNKAASKLKMAPATAVYYYNVYRNDPEKKVPSPRNRFTHPHRVYTQEQVENLIRYIVDDKMSIKKASKKAKKCHTTASNYYHKYFKDQHPDTPTPSHIVPCRERYTQEQIKEVIGYIINDKMSINAASKKVNMCHVTASNHYHQYLKSHNMEIPVSKHAKRYTQDEIKQFIRYIVDDKMNVTAASKNANIPYASGRKFYNQYLKVNSRPSPILKHMAQDKKKRTHRLHC